MMKCKEMHVFDAGSYVSLPYSIESVWLSYGWSVTRTIHDARHAGVFDDPV